MKTTVLILAVDDDGDGMFNVRLTDPTTMREVGTSGYGFWQDEEDAVDRAYRDFMENRSGG